MRMNIESLWGENTGLCIIYVINIYIYVYVCVPGCACAKIILGM